MEVEKWAYRVMGQNIRILGTDKKKGLVTLTLKARFLTNKNILFLQIISVSSMVTIYCFNKNLIVRMQ